MIDFNPFLTFIFGSITKEMMLIRTGETISQRIEDIVRWKSLLRTSISSETHGLFPETRDCADSILRVLSAMVPDVEPGTPLPNRRIAQEEVVAIISAAYDLTNTFSRESARSIVVGLERQRAFDTTTLVDKIETAFSNKTWNRLSQVSMREIVEAGRCLAFERYTASGFHGLRAVEYEIRDYIHLLTRNVIKASDRNWGQYIRILTDHSANPKLTALLTDIQKLDRNPLVHPQEWLELDDAVAIFCSMQTALDRLIADMSVKQLLPPESPVTASPV
jgi:hypothetical protein